MNKNDSYVRSIFEIVISITLALILGGWFGHVFIHSPNLSEMALRLPPNNIGAYLMNISLTILVTSIVRLFVLCIKINVNKQFVDTKIFRLNFFAYSLSAFISLMIFSFYLFILVTMVENMKVIT